jgi:hypothetical protein
MMSKKSTANFRTGRVDVSENGRKLTVLYDLSVLYPASLFDLDFMAQFFESRQNRATLTTVHSGIDSGWPIFKTFHYDVFKSDSLLSSS